MSIAFAEIFLHSPAECANCVSGFAPNGRLLFLHRLTGAHEPPQAGSPLTGGSFFGTGWPGHTKPTQAGSPPTGGSFSCIGCPATLRTAAGGFTNGRLLFLHRLTGAHGMPQAGSPPNGRGVFSLRSQRWGFAVCGRRDDAAPAAGTTPYPRRYKKEGTPAVSLPLELLPFPCFLIWRRFPICDRFDMGNGRGFFLPCLSQPIRNVRYRSATHAVSSPQARHKVNCPKGKRGSPGGCLCRATRLRVVADGTCEL